MPQKITSTEICRHIISRKGDLLTEAMALGHRRVGYCPAWFAEDMAAGDLISTKACVASKWRTLLADEIVVREGAATRLDIPSLYIRAGLPVPPEGSARSRTHSQTAEESA